MARFVYLASQDREGGILRCTLSPEGKLELVDRCPIDRPAYLCAEGNRLYALLREPFQMQSGVAEFVIQPDGALEQVGEIQPVHGTISAHILAKNGRVYCANYLSGTTTRMPDRILAHNGRSVNPARQDCSHPHCVTPTPDGNYICINDLGTDCIYVCTEELEEVSRVRVPAGSGPRHLVFSGDGKYAYGSNEMGSSVSVFAYESGVLTHLCARSTLPEGYTGENSASAIRLSPDSKTLYVSNRGHDSVCVFDVSGETLTNPRFRKTCGASPREIALVGDWLLCANENSNNITVFSLKNLENPEPVSIFPVIRPWCILPIDV